MPGSAAASGPCCSSWPSCAGGQHAIMCLLWLQAQLPLPAVMTHSVAETDAAIVQLC